MLIHQLHINSVVFSYRSPSTPKVLVTLSRLLHGVWLDGAWYVAVTAGVLPGPVSRADYG